MKSIRWLLGALIVSACGGAPPQADTPSTPAKKVEPDQPLAPAEPTVVQAPRPRDLEAMTADLGEGVLRARLVTSLGVIECELLEDAAPMTVANFVGLARGMRDWVDPATSEVVARPLYQDLPFHRVIPNFAIQTGDPTGTGRGGPGYTFPDEFSREHRHSQPGTLSMANHGPDTNGSQFFITEKAVAHLDFRHTVFGYCEDLDVVTEIARTPTGPDDEPTDPPILQKVDVFRGDSP